MTNIALLSWLLTTTNVSAITDPVSDTEKDFTVLTVELQTLHTIINGTNYEMVIGSNVLSEVRSTLRFNGMNWLPGLPEPKPVVYPPLPFIPEKFSKSSAYVTNTPGLWPSELQKDDGVYHYPTLVFTNGQWIEANTGPKPPLPRFAIPITPPALPDAAMLEKERIEREKVAKEKRDPKRRS